MNNEQEYKVYTVTYEDKCKELKTYTVRSCNYKMLVSYLTHTPRERSQPIINEEA